MRGPKLFFSALLLAAGCAVFPGGAVEARSIKCPVTRDVWVSAYQRGKNSERDDNMGAADRFKLKFFQEFAILDFDVSKLKGKRIKGAWLYLKPLGKSALGLNGGTDIRWLTVSTVSHDWVEGKSAKYAKDTKGHGATFNESSFGKRSWGWPGAKLWDVVVGNGNSLRFDGMLGPAADAKGWVRIELDPRLIRALVGGASHGLFLYEGNADWHVDAYFAARESGKGPYLQVATDGEDRAPPQAPDNLELLPAPKEATATHGALRVRLKVPAGAFVYRAKLDGKAVARWQLPFAARAGTTQTFPLLDLKPEQRAKLEIAAVDGAGNVSSFAQATSQSSPKLTAPKLPAYGFAPKGGEPKTLGEAKVWAFPEITKLDPVSGQVRHEKVAADFRRKNPVWDGASGTVRLAAAKGEIVSFQIAVEGKVKAARISVSALKGPGERGEIPKRGVRLWRNWYVGQEAEYALPLNLKETFDCPAADNAVKGQKLQAVTVDYHIPKDTKPGDYTGTVTLSAGGQSAALTLRVKVYDVTIPDEVHFNPELNCYGGPGKAGSAKFKDSYRLAHYHRCTINRVPYSQGGNTHADWIPKVDGKGHVTDWSNFDNNLGGALDGSWFKDNPRASVPVPTFYLPFYEGWPLDFREHYHPGNGVKLHTRAEWRKLDKGQKWKAILKYSILSKPVDEAFDPAFKDAFISCVKDFVAHFKEKGWNRTLTECYLNNKFGYGYTLWTLDEPSVYLDWATINFFGKLFKKGIQDPAVYTRAWQRTWFEKGLGAMKRARPSFVFRGDISRPWWQGSVSDGLIAIMYSNRWQFKSPRLMSNHKRRLPSIIYAYGSTNKVGQNNWAGAAWCLKAFVRGCDGVLPWQSLGGADALRKPTKTALIVDGGPLGHAIASFRVHAFRRGAQDAELLRLLQLKKGWTRARVGLLLARKLSLSSTFKPDKFVDAADEVSFGRLSELSSRRFCEMKEGVLKLLAAP